MLYNLMAFRRAARETFQRYQYFIEIIFKFIISFEAYDRIVTILSYNETLGKGILKLAFGLAGAILPPMITILLCIVVAVYEVFSGSPVMAALVLAVFVVLYCFGARFSGKFAYAIVAIPLLIRFNMHYIVALLLGMTATPLAIFPAAVGIITYYVFGAVQNSMTVGKISSMDEVLAMYIKFINDILANREMLYIIMIFAAVIVIMWALRQVRFDFSFEITIIAGGLLMIIGHIVAAKQANLDLAPSKYILGSLASVVLVYIVQFFRVILNYSGCESVQFEDDDYVYYVRAVPKLDRVVLGEMEVPAKTEKSPDERGFRGLIARLKQYAPRRSVLAEMMDRSEKENKAVQEKRDRADEEEFMESDSYERDPEPEETPRRRTAEPEDSDDFEIIEPETGDSEDASNDADNNTSDEEEWR